MSRGSNPTKVRQWSDRLERFAESGQTVAQFCQAEGVSQPSFYQWKKKLGTGRRIRGGKSKRSEQSSRAKAAQRGGTNEPAFQPVHWAPLPGLRQSTMIRLADGVEIELGDNLQVVAMVVRSVVERVLPGASPRTGAAAC